MVKYDSYFKINIDKITVQRYLKMIIISHVSTCNFEKQLEVI